MTKKKEYKKPITEAIRLMADNTFMANTVTQDDWADAKQNDHIVPEDDEPFEDNSEDTNS